MLKLLSKLQKLTPSFSTDESRWEAVLRRDGSADGAFFFAVKTTGVYCRPSCPARRPECGNVEFFASAPAAERSGYRACRRCRPNASSLSQRHVRLVTDACRAIEQASHAPDLDALARSAGLSRFHFHRLFKSITGVTPKSYAIAQRDRRTRRASVASKTRYRSDLRFGFPIQRAVSCRLGGQAGHGAATARNAGAGATVRFAVSACPLGSILVAASEKGICAISLGDDPNALVRRAEASLSTGDA